MKNFKEILQNTEKGKELHTRLCNLKTVITPELEKITEIFPEYTKHDITHSENIIENLTIIISDKLKEDLNEFEIYFLLCSTYLHDVGMVFFASWSGKTSLFPTITPKVTFINCLFLSINDII